MSRKFPVGTKNTKAGEFGGLSTNNHKSDTKRDMSEITPRSAQSNKKNYAITPYQTNGCKS